MLSVGHFISQVSSLWFLSADCFFFPFVILDQRAFFFSFSILSCSMVSDRLAFSFVARMTWDFWSTGVLGVQKFDVASFVPDTCNFSVLTTAYYLRLTGLFLFFGWHVCWCLFLLFFFLITFFFTHVGLTHWWAWKLRAWVRNHEIGYPQVIAIQASNTLKILTDSYVEIVPRMWVECVEGGQEWWLFRLYDCMSVRSMHLKSGTD